MTGGAEAVVDALVRDIQTDEIVSQVVYFNRGRKTTWGQHETCFETWPRDPRGIFRLRRHLKQLLQTFPLICVHAHLTWPLYYVPLAARGLPVLSVYTEHSTGNYRRGIPGLRFLERAIYRRFNKVVCISGGVRDSLVDWLGPQVSDDILTIYNGAKQYGMVERPSLTNRRLNLLSVGSLRKVKGFETTIQSMRYLRDIVETYTIVGEGFQREALERLVRRVGVADMVRLPGWSSDVAAHYAEADIQLIPSRWEGFGLVAVEGQSSGLPMVATALPGLREACGEANTAATFVPPSASPQEWAEVIRAVATRIRAEGPEFMAQAAHAQAQKFAMETMVGNYQALYQRLRATALSALF
jgi:glycosyltransferase involved in cell wall biosynthesis